MSSLSRIVSSISVVSVPLEEGAIGDGSAISLAVELRGDGCARGCRKFECSAGLPGLISCTSSSQLRKDRVETYRLATTGETNGLGELGESV